MPVPGRVTCAAMTARTRTELTYRYERWRAVASGILETAGTTFLLLIAVRWFQAGATAKALVAGGGSLGLMLTPLVVSSVARLGWSTATAASRLAAAGATCFLLMALWPLLPVFIAGSVLALTASAAAIPLLTQIYQENYPEGHAGPAILQDGHDSHCHGRVVQRTGRPRPLRTNRQLPRFAPRFCSGFCRGQFPSGALSLPASDLGRGTHPFRSWRFVRADSLFRRTLVCWMLMGFANLMMIPMRVEFLANPKYGLVLTVGEIAFFTGVIPNLARLILSPIWGGFLTG